VNCTLPGHLLVPVCIIGQVSSVVWVQKHKSKFLEKGIEVLSHVVILQKGVV